MFAYRLQSYYSYSMLCLLQGSSELFDHVAVAQHFIYAQVLHLTYYIKTSLNISFRFHFIFQETCFEKRKCQ